MFVLDKVYLMAADSSGSGKPLGVRAPRTPRRLTFQEVPPLILAARHCYRVNRLAVGLQLLARSSRLVAHFRCCMLCYGRRERWLTIEPYFLSRAWRKSRSLQTAQ